MRDFPLHCVKAEDQLFVARYPVNNWIGHILEVLRFLLAHFDINLGLLL